MDNRLREIEQWVAEARDGLSDGGREAYVRKLYLLDAEIRAVIKDSGILPQADSPRPAISLVRRLSSLALPVASALVVLAVSTAYLRGGAAPRVMAEPQPRSASEYLALNGEEVVGSFAAGATQTDLSILTARPDGAQKNTPPAGPSSTPLDADEPAPVPARQQIVLARPEPAAREEMARQEPAVPHKPASGIILASATRQAAVGANESTSVAPAGFILASYTPPAKEGPAIKPQPRKEENRKATESVEPGTSAEPQVNEEELEAVLAKHFERK